MDWLISLFATQSAAQSIFVLALVAVVGIAIGKIRIFSVCAGIAGVLFSGLLFGHLGIKIEPGVMSFAREADLRAIPGPVTSDRILVSHREVSGKSLHELQLNEWFTMVLRVVSAQLLILIFGPG